MAGIKKEPLTGRNDCVWCRRAPSLCIVWRRLRASFDGSCSGGQTGLHRGRLPFRSAPRRRPNKRWPSNRCGSAQQGERKMTWVTKDVTQQTTYAEGWEGRAPWFGRRCGEFVLVVCVGGRHRWKGLATGCTGHARSQSFPDEGRTRRGFFSVVWNKKSSKHNVRGRHLSQMNDGLFLLHEFFSSQGKRSRLDLDQCCHLWADGAPLLTPLKFLNWK